MNTIQLTGRLTRDPEAIATHSGTSVTRMRLAVDRMGRSNETGYIDVTSFGNSAEAAARILSKGWLIAVTGRLEYGEWETDKGDKRSGHTVIGHVEFLAAPKGSSDDDVPAAPVDDDIPF